METTNGSGAEWPSGWRGKILLFVGNTMPEKKLLEIGVLCGRCTAADLDVVVVPL
jgi:hypothetical protein